jgi:hypothetical protein
MEKNNPKVVRTPADSGIVIVNISRASKMETCDFMSRDVEGSLTVFRVNVLRRIRRQEMVTERNASEVFVATPTHTPSRAV